jgi:hypothetical protein
LAFAQQKLSHDAKNPLSPTPERKMTAEHEKKDIVPEATAVLERKATTPMTSRAKPADTGIVADFTDRFCEKISSLKFIPDFITKKCAERKSEAKK